MITAPRVLLPLLALGFVLGACKEDDLALDSGVDGAKSADELTVEEQEQFCEAADAYGERVLSDADFRSALCTLQAIDDALAGDGSVDTCDTLRKLCLTEEPAPEPEPGMDDTCSLGIDWGSCMATVAELEACYEEFGESFAARMRSFSCSKMAEYQASPPDQAIESGPDCSLAKAKCPTVMAGA